MLEMCFFGFFQISDTYNSKTKNFKEKLNAPKFFQKKKNET